MEGRGGGPLSGEVTCSESFHLSCTRDQIKLRHYMQARNQDLMWGGANEATVDPTTEMYFLFSDPFI